VEALKRIQVEIGFKISIKIKTLQCESNRTSEVDIVYLQKFFCWQMENVSPNSKRRCRICIEIGHFLSGGDIDSSIIRYQQTSVWVKLQLIKRNNIPTTNHCVMGNILNRLDQRGTLWKTVSTEHATQLTVWFTYTEKKEAPYRLWAGALQLDSAWFTVFSSEFSRFAPSATCLQVTSFETVQSVDWTQNFRLPFWIDSLVTDRKQCRRILFTSNPIPMAAKLLLHVTLQSK